MAEGLPPAVCICRHVGPEFTELDLTWSFTRIVRQRLEGTREERLQRSDYNNESWKLFGVEDN